VQKELPRLRHFYLEIADTAFGEDIARKTPLTECPWVDSGFPEDLRRDDIINPSYQRNSLTCLRIENNGGTAALNCIVEADVYALEPTSVAAIDIRDDIRDLQDERIKDLKQYKSERITFTIGDLEPGKAIILPMFVGATESKAPAASLLAFGRVVLPKVITYTDILGNKLRLEVRQEFYTPIRIDAYVSEKG
jgi:hypothetical protein